MEGHRDDSDEGHERSICITNADPMYGILQQGIACAALRTIQAGRRKVASDLQTTSLERTPKTHGWSSIHEKTSANQRNALSQKKVMPSEITVII